MNYIQLYIYELITGTIKHWFTLITAWSFVKLTVCNIVYTYICASGWVMNSRHNDMSGLCRYTGLHSEVACSVNNLIYIILSQTQPGNVIERIKTIFSKHLWALSTLTQTRTHTPTQTLAENADHQKRIRFLEFDF